MPQASPQKESHPTPASKRKFINYLACSISLLNRKASISLTLIMGNITLTVDEEVVKKVRRIALEKDTTLTALVRDYLIQMAESVDARQLQDSETLRNSFRKLSRPMGKRDWSRDDLYE